MSSLATISDVLPIEVMQYIFSYLDYGSLKRVSEVNSYFFDITNHLIESKSVVVSSYSAVQQGKSSLRRYNKMRIEKVCPGAIRCFMQLYDPDRENVKFLELRDLRLLMQTMLQAILRCSSASTLYLNRLTMNDIGYVHRHRCMVIKHIRTLMVNDVNYVWPLFDGVKALSVIDEFGRLDVYGLMELVHRNRNSLKELKMKYFNRVSLTFMCEIKDLTSLELHSWTATNEEIRKALSRYPNLKRLRLNEIDNFDDSILAMVVEKMKKLEELWIVNCKHVTAEGFPAISRAKHLKKLVIETSDLTPEAFKRIFRRSFPKLVEFSAKFYHYRELAPLIVRKMALNAPNLRSLALKSCTLAPTTFAVLAHFLQRLQYLELHNCPVFTTCRNASTKSPPFPNLTSLKIYNFIDSYFCTAVVVSFPLAPRLTSVEIMSVEFSPRCAKLLVMKFPQLQKLNIYCPTMVNETVAILCRELHDLRLFKVQGSTVLTGELLKQCVEDSHRFVATFSCKRCGEPITDCGDDLCFEHYLRIRRYRAERYKAIMWSCGGIFWDEMLFFVTKSF